LWKDRLTVIDKRVREFLRDIYNFGGIERERTTGFMYNNIRFLLYFVDWYCILNVNRPQSSMPHALRHGGKNSTRRMILRDLLRLGRINNFLTGQPVSE
jgi:hypothetical protein